MRYLFLINFILCTLVGFAQDNETVLKNAKQAYLNKDYHLANQLLSNISEQIRHNDENMLYLEALNEYELANYTKSVILTSQLVKITKKTNPDYYYLLGKSLHKSNKFHEAIVWYKKYLSEKTGNEQKIKEVISEIKRAWKGKKLIGSDLMVIVENIGNNSNSEFDDFNPVISINHEDRIYFSSSREKNNAYPKLNGELLYQDDIFQTHLASGFWQQSSKVEGNLNSEESDNIQDFNSDGRVAIIKRGKIRENAYFYVDSLDRAYSDVVLWKKEFLFGESGDKDLQLINDSTYLFSSLRKGGFGGYDIYVAFRKQGAWKVENMGSGINSEYDEISPFLSLDGRTIFYSSNGTESMGGFDIFTSYFDENELIWSKRVNISRPFNSGADDFGFRLRHDNRTAFFSSDRIGGHGGLDLYIATMGEAMVETKPKGRIFTELKEMREFQSSLVEGKTNGLLVEFKIKPIFYSNPEQLLFQGKKEILDQLISFLKTYPHLTLNINSHTAKVTPEMFDTYFNLQKTEEVVSYLISKGVQPDKIKLYGLGANYPICQMVVNGQGFALAKVLNNRLDFDIYDYGNLPVKIVKDSIEVPSPYEVKAGKDFYYHNNKLIFRVNFVQTYNLFKDDFVNDFDAPIIIKVQGKPYLYCLGDSNDFEKTLEIYDALRLKGFASSKILAFYNGKMLEKEEITIEMLDSLPELKKYILFLE